MPKRLTAIDFDSSGLHVVHAERNGAGLKILCAAGRRIPDSLALNDPSAVGRFIASALAELKLAGSTAVMCLPRGKVVLKQLRLPPAVSSDEVAAMVLLQMQDDLPFGQEQTVIDHIVLGDMHSRPAGQPDENGKPSVKPGDGEKPRQEKPDTQSPASSHPPNGSSGAGPSGAAESQKDPARAPQAGLDVLVAATNRDTINFYASVAESAGIKMWGLGLRPLFDAFAAVYCPVVKGYDCAAILHIMGEQAEIAVVERGKLCFSRSAVLKVPAPAVSSDVQADADQIVSQLIMETVRSLQSFQAQSPESNPGIILTAGDARIEPSLRQALAKKLGIRCEGMEPKVSGLPSGEEQLACVSAVGGAMACLSGNGQNAAGPRNDLFDFTCPKRPPEIRDRRKVRALAAAAAVVLACLGSVLAGHMYLSAKRDRVANLQNQYDKLAKDNKAVKAIKKNLDEIEAWNASQRDWLDHLANLSGLFPSCEVMYINNLRSEGDNQFSFQILSKSGDAITEFGRKLAAFGYEFKPGAITTAKDDLGYTYRSQCRVTIPSNMKLELASIRWEPRPANDLQAGEVQRPSSDRPGGNAPREFRPSFTPPATTTPKTSPDKPAEEPPKTAPPSNWRSFRKTR